MKKAIMICLFATVVGLVSISAETWQATLRRAERMVINVNIGINTGNHNTWSIDKWGALLATHQWLEATFEQTYRQLPYLTNEERQKYGRLYRQRVEATRILVRLRNDTFRGNSNAINRINERADFWWRHLVNGGIINFN